VFNTTTVKRRTLILAAALVMSAALAPSAATARIVELGKLASDTVPPPSCPSTPCLAVSRTTGYQAKVGERRGVVVAPGTGKIVAWSITLARPGRRQVSFFNDRLGGPAAAGLSVLRPGKRLRHRVVAQSPIFELAPYFGTTVQFPLDQALSVRKGYLVALTVPTWAPALAVGLPNTSSWRASRSGSACEDTQTQTAQLVRGTLTQYRCLYRGVRLTYSATWVSTPSPAPRPPAQPPTTTPAPDAG
jgi:hypothetical protein